MRQIPGKATGDVKTAVYLLYVGHWLAGLVRNAGPRSWNSGSNLEPGDGLPETPDPGVIWYVRLKGGDSV